jgi:DNA-binding MarR family transcriptional regulator
VIAATLSLVNRIAFASIGRGHDHKFWETTGTRCGTLDVRIVEHLGAAGPTPISDIARFQMVALSQASRQVRSLTERGLADRERNPGDGRQTLAALTPLGQQHADLWITTWGTSFASPVAHWRAGDARLLHQWLVEVLKALDAAYPDRDTSPQADMWRRLTARDHPPPSAAVGNLQAFLVAFASWVRQTRGFRVLLRAMGDPVSEEELAVLDAMMLEQPASVTVMARRLGVDHSLAGKWLTKLTADQLAVLERTSTDRRVREFRSTPAADAVVTQVLQMQRRLFDLIAPRPDPAKSLRLAELIGSYLDAGTAWAGGGTVSLPTHAGRATGS